MEEQALIARMEEERRLREEQERIEKEEMVRAGKERKEKTIARGNPKPVRGTRASMRARGAPRAGKDSAAWKIVNPK